jgi:4-hydroxybenzoate polyprenyltransferase
MHNRATLLLLENEAESPTLERAAQLKSGVLCVDLDGTFVRTDSLYECLLLALKSRAGTLYLAPFWLVRGRLYFKQMITRYAAAEVDINSFPVQPEIEDFVGAARSAGKRVELISAADHELLSQRSAFRETFDEVIGSSGGVNLKSEAKAEFLRQRHPAGFAYIGNNADDLPVWRSAAERFGANLSPSLRRRAEKEGLGIVELAWVRPVFPALLRSIRPHQWLKNLLIFVPLFLVVSAATASQIALFLVSFALLSALTSGTYLINDLLDLNADRAHPRKRSRPIASGDLSLPLAGLASLTLVGIGLIGGSLISPSFLACLLSYLVLTLAYSFRLKQIALVDVMVIAVLFTVRILTGMVLLGQRPSPWLLMFSIFFFFSLALMKREVELSPLAGSDEKAAGRGYNAGDRTFVVSFGISSGVASLVVFSLFISTITERSVSNYASPAVLWGAMAAIGYWLARMWLIAARGEMHDDPIFYAAKDKTSLALGALTIVLAACAQLFAF